jgi:uncharacterized protein
MTFKAAVLSIDGGGIKGIVPAMVLTEIEERTGKPICELFDFIAGTSTGGILALGLTKPSKNDKNKPEFSAEELVNLYENKGVLIFQRRKEKTISVNILNKIVDVLSLVGVQEINKFNPEDWFHPKYTRKGKDDVILEYLGNTYIKEALTEVLITSYATNLRLPLFFTSNPIKEQIYQKSDNFRVVCEGYEMREAAMATSAAPTYFRPYAVSALNRGEGYYTLVDGGVFANNPTSIAIIEAMKSYSMKTGDNNISLKDVLVVSIGTGRKSHKLNLEDINNWGQLQWIEPLINMVFNGQSEVVDYQLEQLLPKSFENSNQYEQYYRFQPQYPEINLDAKKISVDISIPNVNDAMDDTSRNNIENLKEAARELIIKENIKLNSLCKQLKFLKQNKLD